MGDDVTDDSKAAAPNFLTEWDGPEESDEGEEGFEKDPEHARALEQLQLSAEAYWQQREREKKALRYQVPDLMWPQAARDLRRGEVIGDITIPERPIVSIPKIDAPVQLILNQERAAHLGVSFHPLDENANDETAEVMTGIYRTIERKSRAGLARSWGFERAVKAGLGGWRVLTVPSETYRTTKDQDIAIRRMLYQESAFPDPFAIEPDWSDGEFLLFLEWVSFRRYKRLQKTGKRRNAETGALEEFPSLLATLNDGDLSRLQVAAPAWIRGEGEGRAVLQGEYMYMESRPEVTTPAQKWREREERRVCWRRLNAIEFIDSGYIHSQWLPWVPAVGRELVPFDDERRWMGMYEPNIDSQNVFNYSAANAVESMIQEPRATWLLAEGQEEGHQREFLLANVRNFPYIRYKPKTVGQELAPVPVRVQADTSKLGLSVEMMRMSAEWLHSGTSTFEPSLGQQSPNVRTKGGTLALQAQSEQANSNWLDNQAEISITHESRIVASMIPYYYDRPGRVMMLLGRLGEHEKPKKVILNAPFTTEGGGARPLPYGTPEEVAATDAAVKDPANPAKYFRLMDGLYGTTVSIGKGYKSRIDQGSDDLGHLFQAEPELFKILGDIYLRFRDFPGHEEAAERVKKMLPPQLQDNQDDPRMQLEQAKQALQAMQQELQQLQPEKLKYEAQVQIAQMKEETARLTRGFDVELQRMKDATTLEAARIKAKSATDAAESDADLTMSALGVEHAQASAEGHLDRAHEHATAAADAGAASDESDAQRAHDAATGAAAAGHSAAEAEAGRAGDLEAQAAGADHASAASAQDHAQTLEQVAAQPEPSGDSAGGE